MTIAPIGYYIEPSPFVTRFDWDWDVFDTDSLVDTAKNGHVECLRCAIENGARCDARVLLANPDIQHDAVVQYLRTLLANSELNPKPEDPVDRLRRAQTAIDDVSEHIPEGTYLETMNALGEAHRRVRPRRDDD